MKKLPSEGSLLDCPTLFPVCKSSHLISAETGLLFLSNNLPETVAIKSGRKFGGRLSQYISSYHYDKI